MWVNFRRCFSHKTWATVSPKDMSSAHPGIVKNLVGGQWVESSITVKLPDPLTGELCMTVPETQIPETAPYVAAFKNVPKSGLHNPLKNVERYLMYGDVCQKVAAALHHKDNFDFFVRLIQRNLGKSTGQAAGEMKVVRTFFENFAGDNVRFLAKGFSAPGDHLGQQTQGYRWPYGPVAIIAPFNFPLEIPMLQTMGALFMGNQVLLKPDHRTAICTEQFIRLLHYCGMPTTDVSILNGQHIAVDHLIKKNLFRLTQFTGSSKVAEYLSETTKGKVRLEDAGFDWKVLGPDVSDIDYVAYQSDQDAYAFSGQKCSAQSILLAHSNWVQAGLFQKLKSLAARRKLDDLTIGPVITWTTAKIQDHVDKVSSLPGARVLFGGKPLTGHQIPSIYGAFEPTAVFVPMEQLLANFKLCTTELFGPFQVVSEWTDVKNVLEVLERIDHHLTAAVVSKDTAFLNHVLANSVNGTTYAGIRARTTGAPQNHWFGPAGDPRGAGIGTPEAIKLVWSCHREIVLDQGPIPTGWKTPPAS